jgi:DNA-binding MarR family transcriptional regulator
MDRFIRQEYQLLDFLSRSDHVSQRQIAHELGQSASQVNRLLKELVDAGFVEIKNPHVRPFSYQLTTDGERRLGQLEWEETRGIVTQFRALEDRILARLESVRDRAVRRVVFYGSGDLMRVALPLAADAGLKVVGVVDEDPTREPALPDGIPLVRPDRINGAAPDAVLITTHHQADHIRARLGAILSPGCPVFEL